MNINIAFQWFCLIVGSFGSSVGLCYLFMWLAVIVSPFTLIIPALLLLFGICCIATSNPDGEHDGKIGFVVIMLVLGVFTALALFCGVTHPDICDDCSLEKE